MSREMKDSGIEWIGSLPSTWKICKVKNCFVRKNDKAMQEDPVILSLARSGVKIRDMYSVPTSSICYLRNRWIWLTWRVS